MSHSSAITPILRYRQRRAEFSPIPDRPIALVFRFRFRVRQKMYVGDIKSDEPYFGQNANYEVEPTAA